MKLAPLLFAVSLVAAPVAHGQYALSSSKWFHPFDPRNGYVNFESVGIGDVNGDGLDDLVSVANRQSVHIFLQTPDGGLAAPLVVRFSDYAVVWPTELTLVDLTGDGSKEIIVAQVGGPSILSISRGGRPKISVRAYGQGFGYYQMSGTSVLDINADGKKDVIAFVYTSNSDLDRMMVLLGDGAGGLLAPSFSSVTPGGRIFGAAVADINGDGWDDIALARTSFDNPDLKGSVDLLYGSAGGGLTFGETLGSDGDVLGTVAVADIDSDGLMDIVHGSVIYRQTANDVFAALPGQSTLDSFNLLAADLDHNGQTDIVATHKDADSVDFQLQENQVLTPESNAAVSMGYASLERDAIAVGDLNGDHCTDVAFAAGSKGLTWLAGGGCKPRADVILSMELTLHGVVVTVSNVGSIDADNVSLDLGVALSSGYLVDSAPVCPSFGTSAKRSYHCPLGTISSSSYRTIAFSVGSVDITSRSWLTAFGRVATSTPETTASNNTNSQIKLLRQP